MCQTNGTVLRLSDGKRQTLYKVSPMIGEKGGDATKVVLIVLGVLALLLSALVPYACVAAGAHCDRQSER